MAQFSQRLHIDADGQKTTATILGGIQDPGFAPSVSANPSGSSTLPPGTYHVAFTWVNEYGESLPSLQSLITISAGEELVVTLPSRPSEATEANIYIGASGGVLTKQGSTTTTQYTQSIPLVIGDSLPSENTSYKWVTPVQLQGSGNEIIGIVKLTDGTEQLLINSDGSLNIVPIDTLGNQMFTLANPAYTKSFGLVAKEPFSGNSNMTYTFSEPMYGFTISNDGDSTLTFRINGETYTVLAYEVFQESFAPFTEVQVFSSVPFRAYGLGV